MRTEPPLFHGAACVADFFSSLFSRAARAQRTMRLSAAGVRGLHIRDRAIETDSDPILKQNGRDFSRPLYRN